MPHLSDAEAQRVVQGRASGFPCSPESSCAQHHASAKSQPALARTFLDRATVRMVLLLLAIPALYVGNHACLRCHSEIAKAYATTPMAISSGRVTSTSQGSFRHAASGISYEVDASGVVSMSHNAARREQQLHFYIGSGAAGRSFLYSRGGFLFEAPVTWYTRTQSWDMSPGYEPDRNSRWNRAVEPSCLYCHASQTQWRESTQNGYQDPPFLQDGISCERCHGPGALHVQGKAAMVNPAKLEPSRRDSVCAQCHLSGEARVTRSGRNLAEYRPGDLLSDYVAYFVPENRGALQVNSHVEKLAQSMCKRSAGDQLWCDSCHDPHRVPTAADRAAFFRSKCLTCHEAAQCERGFDCASCHMPKTSALDAGHGVFTDHSIPRVPAKSPIPAITTSWQLRPFSQADARDRELGLAYAEVVVRTGDPRQRAEAIRLLTAASQDAEVQSRLGSLVEQRALSLYQSALRQDPDQIVALVNLGRLLGTHGLLDEAIALWRNALKRNPCLPEAGTNLQIALRAKNDLRGADAVRRDQAFCIFE